MTRGRGTKATSVVRGEDEGKRGKRACDKQRACETFRRNSPRKGKQIYYGGIYVRIAEWS